MKASEALWKGAKLYAFYDFVAGPTVVGAWLLGAVVFLLGLGILWATRFSGWAWLSVPASVGVAWAMLVKLTFALLQAEHRWWFRA